MDTRTLRLLVIVVAILIGIVFVGRVAASRLANAKKHAAAYALACEGPPLRTVERRNKAMEDGYLINQMYDCIDKAAFADAVEEKKKWDAANTPEAKARAASIKAAHDAENATLRALAATIQPDAQATPKPDLEVPFRIQDANTAPEADLAQALGMTPDTARQMVEERTRQPFKDWDDMRSRVAALRFARHAMYANIGGLRVNGQPLPGGPPDDETLTVAKNLWRRQHASDSR